mgnify:CR=1 FL=1
MEIWNYLEEKTFKDYQFLPLKFIDFLILVYKN